MSDRSLSHFNCSFLDKHHEKICKVVLTFVLAIMVVWRTCMFDDQHDFQATVGFKSFVYGGQAAFVNTFRFCLTLSGAVWRLKRPLGWVVDKLCLHSVSSSSGLGYCFLEWLTINIPQPSTSRKAKTLG